ncbi:MAG: Nif3-like dinuclear metal center hexameric protein [Acidimicrobiia bacterium]
MIVGEILRGLVLDKAASWDPVGLQLGDENAPADSVGVCHQVTDHVVDEAEGLDLLITYHPLLFKPIQRLLAGSGPEGRAHRLIRTGVNLAVVHTAWDAAPGGTADALAAALNLSNVRGFGLIEPRPRKKLVTFVPVDSVAQVVDALAEAGAGTIGNYRGCSFRSEGMGAFLPQVGAAPAIGRVGQVEEAEEVRIEVLVTPSGAGAAVAALLATHPYEEPTFDLIETTSNLGLGGRIGDCDKSFDELVDHLTARFGQHLRAAAPPDPSARRVAVLPGSGGSFAGEAATAGAHVLVTGDLDHHQFVEALDLGMAAIDIGHAASEQPGVKALLDLVGKMVPNVIDLSDDPTPWRR